ncbi:cholesterol 24-hydroxylase [Seriola lalandi dorsalis]|uniref:Cholesterol 24-hydroxylase n=1 Tax=Seriola lalandi dorsalis TaxID=1841481 RepID=A0A3B4WIA3_SERLL|nr:cholesterol 24-hydroxylase [Seriola lalandi dorsalis]XP_056261292.1 cholesterol 24-hydroxylase-like [Seriola aureovittata]
MAVFHVLLSWTAQALMFLFFLIFIAFLGYCLYIKHIHMKYDHIPGPPRETFFFGHSKTLLRLMKNDEIIHDKFLEWTETYGPVYRLNFLHYVTLGVSCPEATKEILMSPKYPKDKIVYKKLFNLFGQRFLGNGLITAQDHEQWYKQRRIMDPAFSSLYLRGLMGTFNERAEKLMDKLSDFADSKTEVNMLHLVNCVTLDVIAKVAFGVDLDLLKNSSPFPEAIETCLKGMVHYIRDLFFEFKPKNKPFINEVREACRLLRTTGAQWIHERKTAMQNGDDVPKDILTQIIKTAGKEESMTKEDEELMLDNFVTFFIAGQETTANQLAFCIMELARNPDILEKVNKEVDDVLGMKQDISYDNLGELTYLSQVLKETLRIYPTAPGTSREVHEDMVIAGIHIPGGVTCFFSSYVTGRLDRFFRDPLTFDPDRFHPDVTKPYYCYYPFALGPRSCLGQNFAQMEAKVVMAKLLQRFDFTLVPGQTFDILDTGSLRPKSGVVCSVRHRNYKK